MRDYRQDGWSLIQESADGLVLFTDDTGTAKMLPFYLTHAEALAQQKQMLEEKGQKCRVVPVTVNVYPGRPAHPALT